MQIILFCYLVKLVYWVEGVFIRECCQNCGGVCQKWFKKVKNKVVDIEHDEGYDLKAREEDLFIEVKGSTKSNFMDFRPYLTLNELKNAVNKGEKFEIHILFGIKNGEPSEHWVIKGSEFAKYGEFVKAAYEFKECWSKKLAEDGILAVNVLVYLKKIIGQPV